MNNYEHIVSGGIDALLEYGNQRDANSCVVCTNNKLCYSSDCDCDANAGTRKWLEAEYIAPDTQERINEDINKSLADYWMCREKNCYVCEHYGHCLTDMTLDLLARQRRLDGVEVSQ